MTSPQPRITIITPSFNQARFLDQCIDSVLDQRCAHLQYLVMDGGSTDDTLNVLRGYRDRLVWKSERDRGQSDAVNKGLRAAEGEIIGWLNSDDYYLPDSFAHALECFAQHPNAAMIYGRALMVDQAGDTLREYPTFDLKREDLRRKCSICQPAVFVRRSVLADVGLLNEHLDICIDYDWWLRIAQHHEMAFCDHVLAASRHYESTKTASRRLRALVEAGYLMREHFGGASWRWSAKWIVHRWTLDRRRFLMPIIGWVAATRSAIRFHRRFDARSQPSRYGSKMIARLKTSSPPLASTPATLTASTLVLCAGIPRSGSTWLYNAARLLLMRPPRPSSDVYGAWIGQYDTGNPAPWHVIKVHEPDEGLLWRAKVALTSHRDLRDIAASAWKRGWIVDGKSTIAFLDNVVKQHAFWRARCAYEMAYEMMRAEPLAELRRIANSINVTIDDAGVSEVLREIDALGHDDASSADFDAANLLHKQHILDGRVGYHAEALPGDVLREIEQRYGDWLRGNGYAA